jgi:hypothetical protein
MATETRVSLIEAVAAVVAFFAIGFMIGFAI